LDRAKQLLSDGWITKAQFDQRQAARDQARAMVNRAQADTAKRAIRAPFTGRVGIRQIDLGQYLDAGVPIVSLQTVDPVYATAMLPEQAIAQVRVGQPVRVTTDTWTGRVFTGRITALESAIDPSTRTLKVQATLDNPDRALTPGLYAQLSVDLPDARPVVTVPETAIAYSLSGDTVYVLTPSKDAKSVYTVSRRSVQVGQSQPGFVEITAGLKPGEMVATNGQHKLREGGQAVIDNRLALASRPTPPRP
jgi:RND family efflux transporter MFP subunit